MAEKEQPEKRKDPRLEGSAFPVEYALRERSRDDEEKPDAFRRAKAMSVGESGFMLLAQESLSMGDLLRLKLYLPKSLFPFSNWQTIAVEAKVVRIEDGADFSGARRYGLFITRISEQDAACLKNYVTLAHWMKDKIKNQ